MLEPAHFSHIHDLSFGPRISAWREICPLELCVWESWVCFQRNVPETTGKGAETSPAALPQPAPALKSKDASALEQSPKAKDSYWSELNGSEQQKRARLFLCSSKQSMTRSQNQWSTPWISFFHKKQNHYILILPYMLSRFDLTLFLVSKLRT